MRRWFTAFTLCSFLFIGNSSIYADERQESSSMQTEVTVNLIRKMVANQLLGDNGNSNVNSNTNPPTNSSMANDQVSIAQPDIPSGKKLPKTNEQSYFIYSILGGALSGYVICFVIFRKKNERKVQE